MRKIDKDFTSVSVFDLETVASLKDYFDISFINKDPAEYKLWFENLRIVAEQNLGLAHSILHNQSARNSINIAYSQNNLPEFNRPYESSIGAYSFFKGFSKYKPDSLILFDNHLRGTKYWASQLNTADYMVLFVRDAKEEKIVRKVFVDLKSTTHTVTPSESNPIGMKLAFPCDLTIDSVIPDGWILTRDSLQEQLSSFHFYGLTGNYISCARSLLKQAEEQGFNVDYEIKKLSLAVNVSDLLWQETFMDVFDTISPEQFNKLNTQYQFARKTLIDVVGFFLEIMNTGLCDSESLQSRRFRDAVSLGSHVINLYKHLNNGIIRF
jgi:hypothetical protein